MEEQVSIFKRASTSGMERNIILNALQDCRVQFMTFPLEKLEEDLMLDMMPCMRILLLEIYADNQKIDSAEQIEKLLANLTITISLTEFMEDLLNFVIAQLETADFKLFKSIILEIPKCILSTYKHCKESQKKYQNLMRDCKEILLLYKKNQDCHTKFLNIMTMLSINVNDETCTKSLIETMRSVSDIIEMLLGLNIKALADSWKSYCCIIEKHAEILIAQNFHCIKEIELLELQIRHFMDSALESNDEKQLTQYSKLSGFLLKIALKIIVKFWEYLRIDHLDPIYNLVCSIYNYSPELMPQKKLENHVEQSIQLCLLDVITSFIEEKFLCEDMLEQILTEMNSTKKDSIGCLGLNLKILEFVTCQVPDSVDSTFFIAIANLILSKFSTLFPDSHSEGTVQFPCGLFEKISSKISRSIEVHNSFYNVDFESVIISNILGNHIGCHILASVIWIEIISGTSSVSKKQMVSELLEVIHQSQIHVTFSSSKVVLLKTFMHKLFSIIGKEEKTYLLELYPCSEYIHLWRIIGLHHILENENNLFGSLMEFLSNNIGDMKSIASVEEVLKSLETVKLLCDASDSIPEINKKMLTSFVQALWESNIEVVNCDNTFSKYFISNLTEATIRLIKNFSNDQIFSILKRIELLATTPFMKMKLCFVLSEITNRKTEHNMEQNKLNFVISDLLELLLRENNKMIQDLGLRIFQQFASNNQYIIVNNVSRMLPDMNLEKHLQNNKDNNFLDHFKLLNLTSVEHKCLETKKTLSSGNSFEMRNRNVFSRETSYDSTNGKAFSREGSLETRTDSPIFINKPSVESKRSIHFNSVTSQSKRIKLGEECQEEDTVNEVLQRIKSEIKCLNKVLSKERLTPKNAQSIKMLACQLQNVLEN